MDILERLKQWTVNGNWPQRSLDDDIQEAVDEIERLRGELHDAAMREADRG